MESAYWRISCGPPKGKGQSNPDFVRFDPQTWFAGTRLPRNTIDQVTSIISRSLDEFRAAAQTQNPRETAFNFLKMKEKPRLRLSDNLFIAFSLVYLFERLTMGVYWILFDYLGADYGEQAKAKWSRYNGYLFQR